MNKTKIYQIIRRLTDGMLPESGRRIVVRWLRGQEHVAETDEAMFRIWNEIDGAQVSDEERRLHCKLLKDALAFQNGESAGSKYYGSMLQLFSCL